MTTLKVDMNNLELNQDNTWNYNCNNVTEIDITYDGNIEDNFTSVSYSGSTVTIKLCGLFKFNFTNIKDPNTVVFKVEKADDAVFDPGHVQFSNLLSSFLSMYSISDTDTRATALNIDMNHPTGNNYTYNCKNISDINVTFDSEIAIGPDNNFTNVTLSGSTLTIKVCNLVTYKFTNISNPENINFKVTRSAGAVIPGQVQFDNNLEEFCKQYVVWTPISGVKVTGSNFDDTIVFSGYTGTKGFNINAGLGDDTITATLNNDTISGGAGKNVINLSLNGFGVDAVALTKGEELVLNIPDSRVNVGDGSDTIDKYYKYEIAQNRKDLVVTVYKDKVTGTLHTADTTNISGILTIKNYAVKDVLQGGTLKIKAGDLPSVNVIDTVSMATKLYKDNYNPNDKTQLKSASFAGTWINDNVDASNYKDSAAETKVQNDTTKVDAIKGVTIKAGVGNDTITGSRYADTITAGTGINTIIYDADTNFGNDVVNLTKGEILNIDIGLLEAQYEPGANKNDLLITLKNGKTIKGTVTLKNYLAKDLGATVIVNGVNLAEIASLTQVTAENYFEKDGKINAKYVGTALADDVDAYGLSKPTKTVKEVKYGVTIQTGLGDDVITGSKFNDTITGGVGVNTIKLYTTKDFGDDTIILTKAENLILKVEDLDVQDAYLDYTYVHLNGNNLVVDVYDRAIVWDLQDANKIAENFDGVKRGSVTIKDYIKKDVITNEGSFTLIDNNHDSVPMNVRRFTNDVLLKTTSKFTGTWIDDNIDATEYVVKKNGANITDTTAGYEKVKGVNVNLGGSVYGNIAEGSIYADTLIGGANTDYIWGGKGNDSISGGAGDDLLRGQEGNDTILGGDGSDLIYGGAGDDVLNGGNGDDYLVSDAGNDKLTGGKGKDTFAFTLSGNTDVDTITDANNEDIIRITNLDSDELQYVKNGNNLEITGINDAVSDKIVVQNYFKTKDNLRIEKLQAQDMLINISEQTVTVQGKGAISGTSSFDRAIGSEVADTIKTLAGNDTISAGAGNDNIWGGLGDDSIDGGTGKNAFYYSLGDGNDTIVGRDDAHDTLVFDSGIKVSASIGGDDLMVTYSGRKNNVDYENTITVADYNNNKKSVEKIKVGNVTKNVTDYLNGGGGGTVYKSTEEAECWFPNWTSEYGAGAKITEGNHTFVYDYANLPADDPESTFSQDIILSPNVVSDKTYTETFQFVNNSVQKSDIFVRGDDLDMYVYGSRSSYMPDAIICYDEILDSTDINKPNIIIKDADNKEYILKAYRNRGGLVVNNSIGSAANKNNITAIGAEKDSNVTTTVISNNKWNNTNVNRSAINYTYNGGYDRVDTDEYSYTNDTYNISSFSTGSHLRIREGGGTNDTINFNYTGATADDIRIIIQVDQWRDNILGSWDKMRIFFAHKDSLTDDVTRTKIITSHDQSPLPAETIDGTVFVLDLPQAQEYPSSIENILINGNPINAEAWYDAVLNRVSQVLRDIRIVNKKNCGLVISALESDEVPEEQKQKIIDAYKTLKYSDIVFNTVNTANANVPLAENKFNRYTFSGNYNGAVVTSGNTLRNGFNDTLIFSDASFDEGTLELKLVDGTGEQKDLQITSNGKTVLYKDYLNGNNSDLIIIDKNNRKMSVSEYVPDADPKKGLLTTHFMFGSDGAIGTYNAVFIKDDGSHGYNEDVTFDMYGKSHNYVYTEGGIKLHVDQSGEDCHSTAISASVANDTYFADLTSNLQVEDYGGVDTLQVSVGQKPDGEIYSWDNVGIVFNVVDNSFEEAGEWTYQYDENRNHIVFVDKDAMTAGSIQAAVTDELVETTGVNIIDKSNSATGAIERVADGWNYAVQTDAWYNAVAQTVGTWLHNNNYGSVADVVEHHADRLDELVEVFQGVNYSEINV